jgi:hypothetical protein
MRRDGARFVVASRADDGGRHRQSAMLTLKRAAKKWMPVFRKSRAFSGTLEPVANQSKRNWV